MSKRTRQYVGLLSAILAYYFIHEGAHFIYALICGAFKNIIALAAGISRGMGFGDNASAALITRGAAEIMRMGARLGANPQTFFGLAGIGDLIVTCTSVH